MNSKVIIGILVVLVLLAGGYYFLTMNAATTTTTTATTDMNGNTTTGSSGTTQPSAPAVITNSTVAPTNSTAVVTGTVTPDGAQTTYWYEYGTTAALGSQTSAQTIGSGWSPIASPGYITGLQGNTTYYFRLSAANADGTIDGATYTFSTNNNPAGQGTAPAASTNAATAITSASATLNAHVDPHASATTFWFEYGTTSDFGAITSFQSAGNTNTSGAVAAQLTGLAQGTTYYFRVNAQNQYGTVNGATQSFTTTGSPVSAAPVVTTQVASPIATTTATLRGTVNPSGAQTTYWFEYSTDSLLGSVLLKTTPHQSAGAAQATNSVQANISSLQPNTTYYYRTVAQNAAGTVRGDDQTFTTK